MGRGFTACVRVCLLNLIIYPSILAQQVDLDEPYLIGQGIADVTGPAAEVGMMGYASTNQTTAGIHTRNYARAFIVSSPDGSNPVVFVSVDNGQIFQSISQGVVSRLKDRFNGVYHEKNIVLSATHTHSGVGGHSHYTLYNLTILGYVEQNYEAIVGGVVKAIENAHHNLSPGRILMAEGQLTGGSVNRSMAAFGKNPRKLRRMFHQGTDPEMLLLKFMKGDRAIGVVNWYGVHPVSINADNRLISSDHKGYAQISWEHERRESRPSNDRFVAAFAQTASGDQSPNLKLDGTGPGHNHFDSARVIGEQQLEKAKELFREASTNLRGPTSYGHRFVDMSRYVVTDQFTGGRGTRTTCGSALGVSFAAGTEDGRGPIDFIFEEGIVKWNPVLQGIADLINRPSPELEQCQAPKPIFLATGKAKPFPWVPEVLPFSILRIGQLSIVAIPGEITVAAGYMLRRVVAEQLGGKVVIAGLANAYSNYVTTYDEYQAQHYEGASTLFGPFTHSAYLQIFHELSSSMEAGLSELGPEPQPRDLKDYQTQGLNLGVVMDGVPSGMDFGDVRDPVLESYGRGDTVFTSFWTGHPKNNLRLGETFLEIQYHSPEDNQWKTIATDADWSTRYRWQRMGWKLSNQSLAIITWKIPQDILEGRYRVIHHGDQVNFLSRDIKSFTGISQEFLVKGSSKTGTNPYALLVLKCESESKPLRLEDDGRLKPNGDLLDPGSHLRLVYEGGRVVRIFHEGTGRFAASIDGELAFVQGKNQGERFKVEPVQNNKIALRSLQSNLYLKCDGSRSGIRVDGPKVEKASTFKQFFL